MRVAPGSRGARAAAPPTTHPLHLSHTARCIDHPPRLSAVRSPIAITLEVPRRHDHHDHHYARTVRARFQVNTVESSNGTQQSMSDTMKVQHINEVELDELEARYHNMDDRLDQMERQLLELTRELHLGTASFIGAAADSTTGGGGGSGAGASTTAVAIQSVASGTTGAITRSAGLAAASTGADIMQEGLAAAHHAHVAEKEGQEEDKEEDKGSSSNNGTASVAKHTNTLAPAPAAEAKQSNTSATAPALATGRGQPQSAMVHTTPAAPQATTAQHAMQAAGSQRTGEPRDASHQHHQRHGSEDGDGHGAHQVIGRESLYEFNKLQAGIIELINSGYIESVKQLRETLMIMEWDMTNKHLAKRRAVASFERYVAEHNLVKEVGGYSVLSALYENPDALNELLHNDKMRMLARSMIEESLNDRRILMYHTCNQTAKEMASMTAPGVSGNVLRPLGQSVLGGVGKLWSVFKSRLLPF